MFNCSVSDPRWHHLVNLLFHTVNTLLLFRVMQGMTGMTWRSAFVAGLFAVHPLHVESVAWVAERKDVLSTFFFMLTLLFYTRFAREQRGGSKGPAADEATIEYTSPIPSSIFHLPSSSSYYLALVFFALGLMSKPMLVTVPFVLLLLDVWPLQRVELADKSACLKTLRPLLLEKIPFFILSLASSCVTFVAQSRAGAVVPYESVPLDQRLANTVLSYGTYLEKTFWPAKLAMFYPYSKAPPSLMTCRS